MGTIFKFFNSKSMLAVAIAAVAFSSCSDDDGEVVNKVTVPAEATILSEKETANCYIAAPGTTVAFSTAFKGNSTTASTGDVAACRLLWTDCNGLVSKLEYAPDEKMAVAWLGPQSGNAVIAATDTDGDVLWSWHLWVTDYDPEATAYTTAANASGTTWTFMDRNLGALSASPADGFATHGLIYQWGRKDPFPAPASETELDESYNYVDGKDGEAAIYDISGNRLPAISTYADFHGTVALSVANPMTFYAMTYKYTGEVDEYGEEIRLNDPLNGDWAEDSDDDFWGGETGKKTMYDPCPPGWKVPVCDADGNTPYAWMKYATMQWDTTNHGAIQDGQWFPACGTRAYVSGGCDYQAANPYGGMWVGTKGKTASDIVAYPTVYGQYMFIINGKRTYKMSKDRRSQGMSVRAVRDI